MLEYVKFYMIICVKFYMIIYVKFYMISFYMIIYVKFCGASCLLLEEIDEVNHSDKCRI